MLFGDVCSIYNGFLFFLSILSRTASPTCCPFLRPRRGRFSLCGPCLIERHMARSFRWAGWAFPWSTVRSQNSTFAFHRKTKILSATVLQCYSFVRSFGDWRHLVCRSAKELPLAVYRSKPTDLLFRKLTQNSTRNSSSPKNDDGWKSWKTYSWALSFLFFQEARDHIHFNKCSGCQRPGLFLGRGLGLEGCRQGCRHLSSGWAAAHLQGA